MILLVDDELRRMQIYIEELAQSGYESSLQTEVDSGFKFFEENQEKIDLLILDLMMPPGESFELEKTNAGLRTGYFFYKRVRQKAPHLPIIIFTNVADGELLSFFGQDRDCWFFQKLDFLPFELVEQIGVILQRPTT